MDSQNRIYLDNSATTWPKPESVYEAVDHFQREIGAPNGRSAYREAVESNRIVERPAVAWPESSTSPSLRR